MKICLPDYKGNSIVNLMSSIEKACGSKPLYKPLKNLKSEEIKKYKNIVLMVIDGLGYEYLMKNNSFMKTHLKNKITSVFPATTASAISTFFTGVAPQQHAVTGWYMNLKELGVVSKVLRFGAKMGGKSFSKAGVDPDQIFESNPLANRIKTKYFTVLHKDIINSDYNVAIGGRTSPVAYSTLNGFFKQIKKIVKSNNKRKAIYAYWGDLDGYFHEYGTKSIKAKKHFIDIDNGIKKLVKDLKDTIIVITSDHGFIDTNRSKVIFLSKHPKLRECLTLPLCGDSRVKYCYVHPSKTKQFEKYVKTKLKRACTMHKSEELIKKGIFGLFKPNTKLFDRVGDYILIMKDNYVFKDATINKKESYNIGNHSGVSKEEMFVPLIVIKK